MYKTLIGQEPRVALLRFGEVDVLGGAIHIPMQNENAHATDVA